LKLQNKNRIYNQGFEKMSFEKDNVNKLFAQFKNKYVSVDLRGDYQTEGKIIAIDNYLNLVLENENGLETIKGGNVIFISYKEDK
jgi:small nuclear ribonucleoprotein (snRNP)-like protein